MTVTESDILTAVFNALAKQGGSIGQFRIGLDAIGGYPTIAEGRVYMPRDWPVQEVDVPILKIQPPEEDKESLGKNGIQFTTKLSFEVIGEVSRKAEEDDQAAGKVLTALSLFKREIEMAVIGDPVLFGGDDPGLIQELTSVRSKMATKSDGKVHRGAVSMIFEMTYYQGTEDFQQAVVTDVNRFHLYADLINVDDPTGTYVPPMDYTPTPAPRTMGPDGRVEGEVVVDVAH